MSNEVKNKTEEIPANPKVDSPTVQGTVSVTPEQKKVEKEEKVEKKSVAPSTIVEETGINLIPTMSTEEIKEDEKKKKMNKSALVSLSILFSVSIIVVGFNILSKIQLNAERERLNEHERRVSAYSQLVVDNTEILERVMLYKDIEEGKFSTKSVIDYVQSIAVKSGSSKLSEFSFSGSNAFAFSGESTDLEDVAKLWYLLTNDSKIGNINLKSISKGEDGVRYSFVGELKLDQFTN